MAIRLQGWWLWQKISSSYGLKRTYGENTVVSCRMPVEMVKRLDSIGGKTGRTRNELILKCVEFALDKLEIAEEE